MSESQAAKLKDKKTVRQEWLERISILEIMFYWADDWQIFSQSLVITSEKVKTIYNQTVAQSKTTFWQKQRRSRITASTFKDISGTVTQIKKNPTTECPEYLISATIGNEKSATTWQMKYGINSEIHAKTKYKPLTKNSHKGITYHISKLTVLVMAQVWLK